MKKYKVVFQHFFRGDWTDGEYNNTGEGLTLTEAKIFQYKLSKDKDFKNILIQELGWWLYMKYKTYTERELIKLLKLNGYSITRYSGSHQIFTKLGRNPISIPKSLNPFIIRRLIKENNLDNKWERLII